MDVDPVPARPVIAALDVIAGIRPLLRREPDHDRAVGIHPRRPSARADQFVMAGSQGRGSTRGGEGPAAQAVDLRERRPGSGISSRTSRWPSHCPDHLPAFRSRCRIEGAPNGQVAITNEVLYVRSTGPLCADRNRTSQASPLIPAAGQSADAGEQERLRADLASRVLSGPGLWTGWLDELDRRGLLEELLADGVIDEAIASAPHDHQLDRALNAKMTVICLIVGCLFPGGGYDSVLAAAFGLPGLPVKPGTPVPTGPALPEARVLLGEHVMRRLFELDAARTDADLGIGALWHGMQTTAFDGTTAELFACEVLADAFGVPEGGTKPKLRIVAHVRTGSRRWIGAAVGGYTDGRTPLPMSSPGR